MAQDCGLDYISAGGNRHPSAADWDRENSGILAFGSDNNIALWRPVSDECNGVFALLGGHTGLVNAVAFCRVSGSHTSLLISGSVDTTIRIWQRNGPLNHSFRETSILTFHKAAVNCLAVLSDSGLFASGSADGSLNIWQLRKTSMEDLNGAKFIHTIKLPSGFLPLALAISQLPEDPNSIMLAVAGTKASILLYQLDNTGEASKLVATLTGHEGWVRSLAFTSQRTDSGTDLLLASASQDRYVRLWRVHEGAQLPSASRAVNDPALGILGQSLSNKAHRFEAGGRQYSVTFEALLHGHEDWIYTASWQTAGDRLRLLTASADNSLAIWEADPSSGIWTSNTRLGEISVQKGSTTATGSTGGFWIGLWSPDGNAVVSLGRTGSWRLWRTQDNKRWTPDVAITGHTREVKSLAWSQDGSYLLSTGSDQTTRMHAEWKRGVKRTWHEISRPQIHGYDLSCIASISNTRMISGADEKLLRVFDEPASVEKLFTALSGIQRTQSLTLPQAANIPVLGLSNKAMEVEENPTMTNGSSQPQDDDPSDQVATVSTSSTDLSHPPFENHLARHTLWPELEKLYGHGYEISCVAASHDGTLVATACRASSLDHAVIRLYDTIEWSEVKPPLKSHSLTVTSLAFSPDDEYLLSVGRDRQWSLFKRVNGSQYELQHSNPKGHSRMILDCSWAPAYECEDGPVRLFATAGRDKTVKLWIIDADGVKNVFTISASAPVTACAFLPIIANRLLYLAYGLEDGLIVVRPIEALNLVMLEDVAIDRQLLPFKAITRLQWRPQSEDVESTEHGESGWGPRTLQLAIASEDNSVRILSMLTQTQ